MKFESSSARSLFEECLELPTERERQAFLDEMAAHSPKLAQSVRELLKAHDAARDAADGGAVLAPNRQGSDRAEKVDDDAPTMPAASGATEGTRIDRYKLLQRIGEGGMGEVWMAEQRVPVERRVALKIIKAGMDSKQVVARFEAERQALALMDHPHIARVLDGGATEQGRPYFVMELVQGVAITDYANQAKLETRDRLGLFLQVCGAIQHAHQKGIIHRDIKPNNIVVANHDGKAFAKVIDFGIAKATSQRLTEHTLFTRHGQMIGTPAYMSPEQAQFSIEDVDTRADIYSLGCLLYELLTSSPPFESRALSEMAFDEMCRVIREQDPPKPSTKLNTLGQKLTTVASQHNTDARGLGRDVRGELDWIVMKSLEKDRNRRYQTAADLAEDVRRHLDDEPVEANPPSIGYRIGKFTRRHKGSIAAACAIIVALITGLVASLWQTNAAVAARRSEAEQRELAQQLAETRRQELYAAQINLAHQAWLDGDLKRAQTILESLRPAEAQTELRGFEWRYLWLLCRDESLLELGTFPDGTAWGTRLCVSADGSKVAAGAGNTVKVWDFISRDLVASFESDAERVVAVVFSPADPGLLAIADTAKTIKLWDLTTGDPPFNFAEEVRVEELAFSREGGLLASANADGNVELWDVKKRARIRSMRGHEESGKRVPAMCVAFSPDGEFVVSGGSDTHVRVWDVKTGEQIGSPLDHGHTAFVRSLTFSPEGRHLASGGNDGRVCLWDFEDGMRRAARRLLGHQGGVQAVAFSPDGQTLVSGGSDHTLRFWSVSDSKQLRILRGHTDGASSVAYSPDGQWVVSASRKAVKLWDPSTNQRSNILSDYEGWVEGVTVSPDGTTVASGDYHHGTHGALKLWDVASRSQVGPPLPSQTPHPIRPLAYSPDGKFLAGGETDRSVSLWNLSTHKERVLPCEFDVKSVTFSSDGEVLGAAGRGLAFWAVDSGRETMVIDGDTRLVEHAVFASGAGVLVTASLDGRVSVWDTDHGGESAFFNVNDEPSSLAVSGDGSLVAVGVNGGAITLFDVAKGVPLHHFDAHSGIWEIAFTPDSRTLASASWDATVKLWNVATGNMALTFRHVGPVTGVSFSGDGRIMATSCADGTVRLWRAASLDEADVGRR